MVFADSLRNHITYYTYDYRTMKFVFAIKVLMNYYTMQFDKADIIMYCK